MLTHIYGSGSVYVELTINAKREGMVYGANLLVKVTVIDK